MKFEISKHEKYTVFKLNEERLNTLVSPALKSEVITLTQTGTTNLIIDLENVQQVDSSGLSALLVANRACGEHNNVMVLINISPSVETLIKISKLDSVFNVLNTLEEAVDSIFLFELEKDLSEEVEADTEDEA